MAGNPAWVKGKSANPAGRPPGIGKKLRLDVAAMLAENDFNPILEMIALAREPKTGARIKREILSDLASFVLPKLKPVDFIDENGNQNFPNAILIIPDNGRATHHPFENDSVSDIINDQPLV